MTDVSFDVPGSFVRSFLKRPSWQVSMRVNKLGGRKYGTLYAASSLQQDSYEIRIERNFRTQNSR